MGENNGGLHNNTKPECSSQFGSTVYYLRVLNKDRLPFYQIETYA